MKKLLFSLMAVLMLSLSGNASNSPVNNHNTLSKYSVNLNTLGKIKVKLEIGRQSKDCKGFGVCGFAITYTEEIFGVNLEAEIVSIGTVKKVSSTMTEKSYQIVKQYFGTDAIIVEEDFTIDRKTADILGFSNGYTIKKGSYEILYNETTKLYKFTF